MDLGFGRFWGASGLLCKGTAGCVSVIKSIPGIQETAYLNGPKICSPPRRRNPPHSRIPSY